MRVWKYAASAAPEAPKTAPILFTGNICDCLRNAAAAGFDAIEYHTREDADFDYDLIRKTMKATGCRVSMIVTGRMNTEGGLSITSEDPEVEKAALEGMLRYIDMAAEMKSGIVIGWAKGRISLTSGPEAYFERLTRNLRIMDEAAAAKNVPINIEVLRSLWWTIWRNSSSNPATSIWIPSICCWRRKTTRRPSVRRPSIWVMFMWRTPPVGIPAAARFPLKPSCVRWIRWTMRATSVSSVSPASMRWKRPAEGCGT